MLVTQRRPGTRRARPAWFACLILAAGPLSACSGPTPGDEVVGRWSDALSVCDETVPANRFVDGIPAYDQCAASQNGAIYSNNGVDTSTSALGSDWVRTQWSGGYQCTELAHRYLYFRWEVDWIPNGNAGTWCDETPPASSGVLQTSTPVHGDIIVFPPGQCGADSVYGHVALVDTVDSASRVTIVEQNRAGRRSTQTSCARCFLHVAANDGSVEGSGGAPGTGGASAATGGTPEATGGVYLATGGVVAATGGATPSTGGASAAAGGALVVSTGGTSVATGGTPVSSGGVNSATGGSSPGPGGSSWLAGGATQGAGGSTAGTDGVTPGSGGAGLTTGGAFSDSGGMTTGASAPDGVAAVVDGAAANTTQTGAAGPVAEDDPALDADEQTVSQATDTEDDLDNPGGCSCRTAGGHAPAGNNPGHLAVLALAGAALIGRRRSSRRDH